MLYMEAGQPWLDSCQQGPEVLEEHTRNPLHTVGSACLQAGGYRVSLFPQCTKRSDQTLQEALKTPWNN